jgi:epoxyqueuosine reductase
VQFHQNLSMLDLLNLKEDLKTEAYHLGFTHMGVALTNPAPRYQEFQAWIQAGHHTDMGYLSRPDTLAKREDPGLILAGCQRVISLAIPYPAPQAPLNPSPSGHGRLSAYARTRDYHETLSEKLGELEAFIIERTGGTAQVKSYVDTGPILERGYAALAGIGTPGKNTCLIIPKHGSYVFLAEILTDLPLPVDPPFTRDLCGSCQRCIEACPTGCILPDRTIDANRCLSYLTIENKGVIPDPLKTQLGDWLFGCDVCQMVCPHNTQIPEHPTHLGEPLLPEYIDLVELLSLDEAAFSRAFKDTPLWRAKRCGLIRNAALILGNQRLTRALSPLETLLEQDPNPVIQEACAWAIRHIRGERG